jgi:hypothetical protein
MQAFAAVLLDQIVQKFFFETQRSSASATDLSVKGASIIDTFVLAYDLMTPFVQSESEPGRSSAIYKTTGEFIGNLASSAGECEFKPDFVATDAKGTRLAEFDLLIQCGRQAVPVEFKPAPRLISGPVREAEDRFVLQMLKAGFKEGILCFLSHVRF